METQMPVPEVAIIGGSGFYNIAGPVREQLVETPYGAPSGPLAFGAIGGRSVVFLPRHGRDHEYPPHMVNYRANLWALKQAGVRHILATGAAGCLRPDWVIGDIVICDQFVNRTWGRDDTYFNGPITTHISVSNPYCPRLREACLAAGNQQGLVVRDGGVLLVIQGPRFSTRAENRDWRRSGYDLISMTHYPEVVLARELGMCYSSVCLVTDYASVLGDERLPEHSVGHAEVVTAFAEHKAKLGRLLEAAVPLAVRGGTCCCGDALINARA